MQRITTAILIVSLVSVLPVAADLTDGLQVHYNFDDPDVPLGDRGLQELHGEAIGTQMVVNDTQAVYGNAMYTITGSAMRSIAPMGSLNLSQEVTFSCWFWLTAEDPNVWLFGLGTNAVEDGAATGGAFETHVRAWAHVRPRIVWSDFGGAAKFTNANGMNTGYNEPGKWQHVVWTCHRRDAGFTWDAAYEVQQGDEDDADFDRYFFVDHWEYLGAVYTAEFYNDHLIVGWHDAAGKSIWIDEFSIWNRKLSLAELEELHDMGVAGQPLFPPPQGTVIVIQ